MLKFNSKLTFSDSKKNLHESNPKMVQLPTQNKIFSEEIEADLKNKQADIEKFLLEEMRKLQQSEMELQIRENIFKVKEEQFQKDKECIEEKQREINLLLIEQRTQPLSCLSNKQELKERLKSYKFNLYKYYLAGMDSVGSKANQFEAYVDEENEEFYEVFKEFPTNRQAIQKQISILKNFELHLISEKTKLDIGSNFLKTELEKISQEHQEIDRQVI